MQARVLIVDSNVSFVVKVKQALQDTGRYEVTVFATGQAALEHLRRQAQDVAVVDFGLRDMDGPGLIEKLRAVQPDLAIIAIPTEVYRVPDWLRVNGALKKPYRARELDPILQDALDQRAKAPPAKTATLPREEDADLDDYIVGTERINPEELAAQQLDAVRRQAQDLPSGPLDELEAPGADMSLEDLLETLEMTEAQEDQALDKYMTLTEGLSVRELAAQQMDAVRRQAQDLPSGPLDDLEAPGADMSLAEIEAETVIGEEGAEVELSDDWLATLVEGGPNLPEAAPPGGEAEAPRVDMPTPMVTVPLDSGQVSLESHEEQELEEARAETDTLKRPQEDQLDLYLSLTESGSARGLVARQQEIARREAQDFRKGPLDELEAPGAEMPLDALLEEIEGRSRPSARPIPPVESILQDPAFEEILALMAADAEAAEAEAQEPSVEVAEGNLLEEGVEDVPVAPLPQRRKGETAPLPLLEELAAEVEPVEVGEEDVEYLASFQETIAQIASRPAAPSKEEHGDETHSASPPLKAIPAEWEQDFLVEFAPASEQSESEPQEAQPVEDVSTAVADDEAAWLALLEGVESAPSVEAAPGVVAGSETSLDDLLNQIERQIAEAAPARHPRLKKLPPRQPRPSRERRGKKSRRPETERPGRGLGGLFGRRAAPKREEKPATQKPRPPVQPAEEFPLPAASASEWKPVAEGEILPGELPDWLAGEVPEELGQSPGVSAVTEDTLLSTPTTPVWTPPPFEFVTEAEPETTPPPSEPPSQEKPVLTLPAEPIIVEPTLQSGTAYLTPGVAPVEEPAPPPLPKRDPHEWQPAFPGEAAPTGEPDHVTPDALFIYPRRQAPAAAKPSEWKMVAPAEPLASEEAPPETPLPAEESVAAEPVPPEAPDQYAENAQVALNLTQLAVESLAEVLLLTRGRRLMGYTGAVKDRDALDLADAVYAHWDPDGGRRQTQVQFVHLDSLSKDYILYSIATADDMVLSMAFPASTPLGQIRRHAREMARALEAEESAPVPASEPVEEALIPLEAAAPTEPVEAPEPTGAKDEVPPAHDETAALAESTPTPAAPIPDEAQQTTTYTCVWTLRNPRTRLNAEQEQNLKSWLGEVAELHRWQIRETDVRPEYINVQVEAPGADSPSKVVEALMDATSRRLLETYPDRLATRPGQGLWADGYYVVTPGRPLSEREIARFISYQRREQGATGS